MTTITANARPVVTEAAAHAVEQAVDRMGSAVTLLQRLFKVSAGATRTVIERRMTAQRVLELARQYEDSQPGFASDLRAAAYRALDDEQA